MNARLAFYLGVEWAFKFIPCPLHIMKPELKTVVLKIPKDFIKHLRVFNQTRMFKKSDTFRLDQCRSDTKYHKYCICLSSH